MRVSANTCLYCSEPFVPARTGRPRLYCSPRCKSAMQRARDQGEEIVPYAPEGHNPDSAAAAIAKPSPAQMLRSLGLSSHPDDAVLQLIGQAHDLAGALRLVAGLARPQLSWRCADLADRVTASVKECFPECFPTADRVATKPRA